MERAEVATAVDKPGVGIHVAISLEAVAKCELEHAITNPVQVLATHIVKVMAGCLHVAETEDVPRKLCTVPKGVAMRISTWRAAIRAEIPAAVPVVGLCVDADALLHDIDPHPSVASNLVYRIHARTTVLHRQLDLHVANGARAAAGVKCLAIFSDDLAEPRLSGHGEELGSKAIDRNGEALDAVTT